MSCVFPSHTLTLPMHVHVRPSYLTHTCTHMHTHTVISLSISFRNLPSFSSQRPPSPSSLSPVSPAHAVSLPLSFSPLPGAAPPLSSFAPGVEHTAFLPDDHAQTGYERGKRGRKVDGRCETVKEGIDTLIVCVCVCVHVCMRVCVCVCMRSRRGGRELV